MHYNKNLYLDIGNTSYCLNVLKELSNGYKLKTQKNPIFKDNDVSIIWHDFCWETEIFIKFIYIGLENWTSQWVAVMKQNKFSFTTVMLLLLLKLYYFRNLDTWHQWRYWCLVKFEYVQISSLGRRSDIMKWRYWWCLVKFEHLVDVLVLQSVICSDF